MQYAIRQFVVVISSVVLLGFTASDSCANTTFFTNLDRFSGSETLIDFENTGIPSSGEVNMVDNVEFNLLTMGTDIDTGFGPTLASAPYSTFKREYEPFDGPAFLNMTNFDAPEVDLEIVFPSPVTRVAAEIRSGQAINDVSDLVFELYSGDELVHEETVAIRGLDDFFFYGFDSDRLFDRWIIRQRPDYRFDLENLRFETISVVASLDIKPGSQRNDINPLSRGELWVAILSDTETAFDPLQIDIPTARFGTDGAAATRHRVADVNKDGLGDLLLRFSVPETGIVCGDTEADLRAQTFGGVPIVGTDSIETVGCMETAN